jgi:D-alanine--poly(phosphoribitol) ligase subunit 1
LSSPDVLAVIGDQTRSGPDQAAVKDPQRDLSYDDLLAEAARVASGLRARGVSQGDRVALFFPNSVDFVVTALASLWIGAIFVPLAVSDPTARLEVILGDCTPAMVVTADGAEGGQSLPTGSGWPPVAAIAELRSGDPTPLVETDPSDGAYIIYTSGTTGTPNGVLISRAAFGAAVGASRQALALDRQTRTLCVSPFHFDGSFGTLFPTLCSGGAVVIRPRDALLFPRTFFNVVASEAITYTGFSPSYLRLLLTSPHLESLAGSTLRLIALGGEASSLADIRALWSAAPEVAVFNRYGPTETTIAVTHMLVTPGATADGSVPLGHPHAGVTFHLFDQDGQPVEGIDQVGELYIGGRQLMSGYWDNPEHTASVFRDDLVPGERVYRTGDLMRRNRAGDYVYVDRADRVVNRGGVRISLIELGSTLGQVDGVSAAACLTYDNDGNTGIAAFVVVDRALSALDLRQAAAARLPDSMLPDRIELVDALPLAGSSKLDERRLLADAGLSQVRPAAIG